MCFCHCLIDSKPSSEGFSAFRAIACCVDFWLAATQLRSNAVGWDALGFRVKTRPSAEA